MSRLKWAVFLAAILGLVGMESWLDKSNPSGFATSPTLGEEYLVLSNFPPNVGVSEKRTASQFFWRSAGRTGATKLPPKGLLSPVSAVTSGTTSLKFSDLPVGKVIRVGELKFVKVGEEQYLSISPGCVDPVLTTTGAVKNFDYTGGVQSYTAYAGCEYKLEVWGAQGGTANSYIGGYGGYSYGKIKFDKNYSLYIVVGGCGIGTSGNPSQISGGYNGGGYGYAKSSKFGGGGGGATHIASKTGELSNLSSNIDEIIIVAGGGGGGTYYSDSDYGLGGQGGGNTGGNGYGPLGGSFSGGYSGTQSNGGNSGGRGTNGLFGLGGNQTDTSCINGSGGGGGLYGGGAGCGGGGGGGSGYINNSILTDAVMYCYTGNSNTKCTSSTDVSTKTTGTSSTGHAVSQAANTGNGYARITRLN